MVGFLCMYGLDVLQISGENFMSIAPLDISLFRNLMTCLILNLPTV